MPVIPITSQQSRRPAPPPLNPTYLAMAAAQMHSEGRLLKKDQPKPPAQPAPR